MLKIEHPYDVILIISALCMAGLYIIGLAIQWWHLSKRINELDEQIRKRHSSKANLGADSNQDLDFNPKEVKDDG